MLVKSSMESEELAYDTANIVYKNVGPTYNGWWMKEGYGQGYSWVMADHNDYSVRLFFEFMDTGFCYVKVHFTNGAAYEDLIAYSWNYAKESPEYPFEGTQNRVRDFLDNFFEAGGGMDMLRDKYENGHNGYDVDSYIQSAKKPVKSSLEDDVNDLKNKMESMSGEDIVKGIKKTIRRNQKPMLGIKYNVLDQNGGVVGTPMSYEDACDLADDIDGEVVPVFSSRRPIKSSTDWVNRVPDGINLFLYSKDNQAKDKRYFPVGDDWGQTDRLLYAKMFTKDGMQKALAAIEPQLPEGMSIQVRDARGKVYYTYPNNLTSSRKPVKSSVEGLTFDNKQNDGSNDFVQYKVNNQNTLDKIKEYLEYNEDELKLGNVYVTLMYGNNKLVAAQVVDTESSTWDLSPEECIEIFGSDIMTNVSDNVGNHAADEFTDYDVDPETVKSSFVVGKTMNDGSKLYYCEDNCFYDENNYTRPSIKIFDNEQEADKIAKRSKSGFVSPLEK